MVIQSSYSINPDRGFPGQIAEPNSPMRVQHGILHLASADGRHAAGARPGDAVYWDTGNNAFRVPHSAATMLRQSGILTYPADSVANSASILTFMDGAAIEVVTMGVVWVIAGATVEYGDQLVMQEGDFKWDPQTRVAAIANMYTNPMECYSVSGGNNDIIKIAVGYGRSI